MGCKKQGEAVGVLTVRILGVRPEKQVGRFVQAPAPNVGLRSFVDSSMNVRVCVLFPVLRELLIRFYFSKSLLLLFLLLHISV